jgi:hypothetical protein
MHTLKKQKPMHTLKTKKNMHTLMAATVAAPDEMPLKMPSSTARRLVISMDASLETCGRFSQFLAVDLRAVWSALGSFRKVRST